MARNFPIGTPAQQIAAVVQQEVENLSYIALFKPAILECHPDSIRYAMRKVISQNLSFDPDAGLVYLTTRNAKIKVDGQEREVKVLECKPTVNGEISLNRQAGSLTRVNPPEVTYDDVTKQVLKVHVELIVPRYDEKGVIVQYDTLSFDFDMNHFRNWEAYSHRQNMKGKKANEINNSLLNWANANYSNYYPLAPESIHSYEKKGGIQPGFAITKAIKHALSRAKLDKNPYAKRSYNVKGDAVVDPGWAEVVEVDYEEIFNTDDEHTESPTAQAAPPPPPPPATAQAAPPPPPPPATAPPKAAPPVAAAQPPKPAAPPPPVHGQVTNAVDDLIKSIKPENNAIFVGMRDSQCGDDVRALWNAHQKAIQADASLLKYMKLRGKSLDDAGLKTKADIKPAEETQTDGGVPSSSDL